jgi:hypothetical protein
MFPRVAAHCAAGRFAACIVRRSTGVLAVTATLLAVVWPGAARGADGTEGTERGQALYDTRCGACHERSVHRRESRIAKDFEALRAEVARWSATAGGEWRSEEIDLVATYLNARYYKYPCPPSICRIVPRAGVSSPRS